MIDRIMQFPIDLIQKPFVIKGLPASLKNLFHHFDFRIRGMPCGKAGGDAFETPAKRIEFGNFLTVEFGDNGPPLRFYGDTSFRLKPPDGFAHRRAADFQRLGDRSFFYAFAGMKFSVPD